MIILVYVGFLIFAIAAIVSIAVIGTWIDSIRTQNSIISEDISKLQDEVFHLKLELAKLKSQTINDNVYSRAA